MRIGQPAVREVRPYFDDPNWYKTLLEAHRSDPEEQLLRNLPETVWPRSGPQQEDVPYGRTPDGVSSLESRSCPW